MGRRLGIAVVLLALAGCATPPTAGVAIPTYAPRREALAYFPATAPMVAVVATDPQDPGLRRLAASGALKPLAGLARASGIRFAQYRWLLGNDAVIGRPRVGGPLLAVLTTDDAEELDVLARSRVVGHRARPAGHYRGAELYAEHGWAFGVRDRVLLVGRTLPELIEALDTRVGNHAFAAAQLNDALPRTEPPATFVRAYVDLRPFVERAGPAVRAVPVLRALSAAGVAIGATSEELRATAVADTSGVGLTGIDLPYLGKAIGSRPALPDHHRALAVADLGPLATAAQRALRAALPVTTLRLDALRARLSAAGVALSPELLRGPAALIETASGPQLRLLPKRPAVVAAALARAAKHLKGEHLRLTREGAFYVARDKSRVLLRLGVLDGSLVAGDAPAAELTKLAHAPTSPLLSPALVRVPRLAGLYPRPVVFTLAGSPDRLRVDAFSGF